MSGWGLTSTLSSLIQTSSTTPSVSIADGTYGFNTSGYVGYVSGHIGGNISGNLNGNVSGFVSGNVKGNVEGGNVNYPINLPNDSYEANLFCDNSDVTFSVNPVESSQIVQIGIPTGSAGTVYTIRVDYSYLNGTTSTEYFNIFQWYNK